MTEKAEIELKPCPFCGSEADIERRGDRRQSTIYQCTSCSCRLETGEEWDHGRHWNTRAAGAEPVAFISPSNLDRLAEEGVVDAVVWSDPMANAVPLYAAAPVTASGREEDFGQVLAFLQSIEGAGYGGMAEFEIAREAMRRVATKEI